MRTPLGTAPLRVDGRFFFLPRDSAGLFVAPGTSTRCLTAAGKPTALVSADVDILQGNGLSARCSRATCSSGECARCPPDRRTQGQCARRRSDDTARRPDTALRPSAAYDRARRAGGSPRATSRCQRTSLHPTVSIWAYGSLYACFKTTDNTVCLKIPGVRVGRARAALAQAFPWPPG
ncbi:uncharacterized protein TRAVEDRAFT_52682 [Trametes versicolor FP-101664 SS1]|uniref:uncharacterized protein n=1 Tax=Trametes versicolor (strain FP-101664) TaxID=717944 RepID=UPI0004622374|nr:uncharacterized protein TRAVEDRAFT_52682 [Trametes versicolor FP-101664 SS1]EIW53556.1 hypothetical protein TRAVEDRAFT_52682 [Trametes versicolor FP-101664 SS1]